MSLLTSLMPIYITLQAVLCTTARLGRDERCVSILARSAGGFQVWYAVMSCTLITSKITDSDQKIVLGLILFYSTLLYKHDCILAHA